MPGPGYVFLEGDPPEAAARMRIEFATADGEVFGLAWEIEQGQTVSASAVNLPGEVAVRVNAVTCAGRAPIQTDMTTTVVLSQRDGACSITVQSAKPT